MLDAGSGELDAVDELARAAFLDAAFSVREELGRPWARAWIARRTGPSAGEAKGPIGFLVGWHVADELHVLNVATAPAMRRRGVATALMSEALAFARAHRVRMVLLEVRRSNRAGIKLYRALGFTAMGLRPGYYADNGEDAIVMSLALDPETGRTLPGRDEIEV